MDLPEKLQSSLKTLNFSTPTPIQAKTIPLALEGQDIIGTAQTGTGKTMAFCLPVLTHLLAHPKKEALILAPTRELVNQINDVLEKLTRSMPKMKTVVLVGGAAIGPQMKKLRGRPQIVVGTPGRVIDHLERKTLHLKKTGFLVLDESDRMLDMGFAPQLDQILRYLPKERQTLLFSATTPTNIKKLAQKFLIHPKEVSVSSTSKPIKLIKQSAIPVTAGNKRDTLLDELNQREGSVIVFAGSQHRTDRITRFLNSYNFSVTHIHGGRSQFQREQALRGFRRGKYRILIATDIAARGLDVPQIKHVINYDIPRCPEDYVHRIGRTARAGAEGESLTLLLPEDARSWSRIARLYSAPKMPDDFGKGTESSRPRRKRKPRSRAAEPNQRSSKPRRFSKGKTSESDLSERAHKRAKRKPTKAASKSPQNRSKNRSSSPSSQGRPGLSRSGGFKVKRKSASR